MLDEVKYWSPIVDSTCLHGCIYATVGGTPANLLLPNRHAVVYCLFDRARTSFTRCAAAVPTKMISVETLYP